MKLKQLAYLIPAIILFALVVLKAFSSPFTHDEAFSYLTYTGKNFKQILSFREDVSANNHIINTLYMKLVRTIGWVNPGMLRMLSTTSFLLFAISLFNMLDTSKNKSYSLLLLIACCNPYLLDFFALARGYAFSFAMMALSMYSLFGSKKRDLVFWSMQFATISMLANFNLVYFWASFGILHLIDFLNNHLKRPYLFKKIIIQYGFPFIAFGYLFIVFQRLTKAEQLYFGAKENIIESVVNDQLWCFIYDQNYSFNALVLQVWQFVPIAMLLLASAFAFIKNIRQNEYYLRWIKVLFILLSCFLFIELNHRLSGSLYPIKRTALFMSVLLLISLMLMFRFLISLKPISIPTFSLSVLLGLPLFSHTLISYRTMRFREIGYDAYHHEILNKLEQLKTDENTELNLSVNWQLGPALNFYKSSKNLSWLPEIKREPVKPEAQYLLVFEEDLKTIHQDSFQVLLSYPEDGLSLLARKN